MGIQEEISQTLSLVNVVRQALGKGMLTELPDSKPGDSSDCLFYRGLVDCGVKSVDGRGRMRFDDARKAQYIGQLWGAHVDGDVVVAPPQFGRVIEQFDGNKLTHYNDAETRDF